MQLEILKEIFEIAVHGGFGGLVVLLKID